MIRAGFLSAVDRAVLIALARDGSAAHRLARRANAPLLLDCGWSCERGRRGLVCGRRIRSESGTACSLRRASKDWRASRLAAACQLDDGQQEQLKTWVAERLPRTTRQIGAWIEKEFGVAYAGRSGLIALLHRVGLEYHKPVVIARKLIEEKPKAIIESYEKLLNSLGDDEAVLFAEAVHPTHAARPVGCCAP
jgi:hypothetical protein